MRDWLAYKISTLAFRYIATKEYNAMVGLAMLYGMEELDRRLMEELERDARP